MTIRRNVKPSPTLEITTAAIRNPGVTVELVPGGVSGGVSGGMSGGMSGGVSGGGGEIRKKSNC